MDLDEWMKRFQKYISKLLVRIERSQAENLELKKKIAGVPIIPNSNKQPQSAHVDCLFRTSPEDVSL